MVIRENPTLIRAWTTLKSEIGRGRRIASDKERAACDP
ncbi:hypothetical protein CSC41_3853 [Pseudomonas aeruginosa]|nr:hypothetical protein CSC41_3853 [Pseudomonas aeruginosa]